MAEARGGIPDQTSGQLTHRQVLIVLSGLMLGMLLAALDQTIVATALPTIVGDLHGLDHLSWVVTAYLLTTTLSTPLYGKISDLYGRKRIFQIAIVIFLVGSALSGLSRNMDELIVFRAVQGLGGGGLMALAMAIVGDIVSPRERGRYQGYFGAVFALASFGGPLAGGFLTDHLTWRWIFYINIPVGILALVITSAVLRLPLPARRTASIDYTGAALTVGAVTPLLLVTVWGGVTYRWGSPVIVGLLVVSVAMVGAVVWWERRAPEPIFPPHVFALPVVKAALGMTFFVTAAMFAVIIYIPVYLQLVHGASPTASGVELLPLMIGMLTTSIGSGRLVTRFGRYKVFPVVGSATMAVGAWLLTHLGLHTSLAAASGYMVVFGVGMGMTLQIVVVAVQNAVERRDIGSATSSVSFFRNIGAACGSALLGTILFSRLGYWLPRLVPKGTKLNLSQSFTITPKQLHALPPAVRAGVVDSFVRSLHVVFLVGIPIAVLAFVCGLLLKEIPLDSAARGAAEGAAVRDGAAPADGDAPAVPATTAGATGIEADGTSARHDTVPTSSGSPA